jgi:hypothetical protein
LFGDGFAAVVLAAGSFSKGLAGRSDIVQLRLFLLLARVSCVLLILLLMIVLLSVLLSPDFLLLRLLSLALCARPAIASASEPRHGRRFFSTWMIFLEVDVLFSAIGRSLDGPFPCCVLRFCCAALVAVCDFNGAFGMAFRKGGSFRHGGRAPTAQTHDIRGGGGGAGKRSAMDRGDSESSFSRSASMTHPVNSKGVKAVSGIPMRGGIRL